MWLRREWSNTRDRRGTALTGKVWQCSDLFGVLSIFSLLVIHFFFFLILKLFHLCDGQKVRLLAALHAAFPEGSTQHKYSAVGSSLHVLSRAASPPATHLDEGYEQVPKGTVGLPEPEDIILVS